MRDNGTRPRANPIWFTQDEELLISKIIDEIIEEDNLNVMAYNISGDHIHLLLVCEEEEVSPIMQKIKAKTARAVNIRRGNTIPTGNFDKGACSLVDGNRRGEKQTSLWTQKFGKKRIFTEDHLFAAVKYIEDNRIKHKLPPLPMPANRRSLVKTKSYEEAFATEYKPGIDIITEKTPSQDGEKT